MTVPDLLRVWCSLTEIRLDGFFRFESLPNRQKRRRGRITVGDGPSRLTAIVSVGPDGVSRVRLVAREKRSEP